MAEAAADPIAEGGFAVAERQAVSDADVENGIAPATLVVPGSAFPRAATYRFRISHRADAPTTPPDEGYPKIHLEVRDAETQVVKFGAYFDADLTLNDNVYKTATLLSGAEPTVDPATDDVTVTGNWGFGTPADPRALYLDWMEVEEVCSSNPGSTPDAQSASDSFAGASEIRGKCGVRQGSSIAATAEEGEPDHGGFPPAKSVWMKWQAPEDMTLILNTRGSKYDTILAVYATADGSATTDFAALVGVASNDDYAGMEPNSLVTFEATSGWWYYIAIDTASDPPTGGDFVLNWGPGGDGGSVYGHSESDDINGANPEAAAVGADVRDFQEAINVDEALDTLKAWTSRNRVKVRPIAQLSTFQAIVGDFFNFSVIVNGEEVDTYEYESDGSNLPFTHTFADVELAVGDAPSFRVWHGTAESALGAGVVTEVIYHALDRIDCAGGSGAPVDSGNPCDPDAGGVPCPDDPCQTCPPSSSSGAGADCPPVGTESCEPIAAGEVDRTYYAATYIEATSWQQWREGVDTLKFMGFVLKGFEDDGLNGSIWVALSKGKILGRYADPGGLPLTDGIVHCVEMSVRVNADATVTQQLWVDGISTGPVTSEDTFEFDGYADVPGPLTSFPVRFCAGLIGSGNSALQVSMESTVWDTTRIGCGDVPPGNGCSDPCNADCEDYDPEDPECDHCDDPCNPNCPDFEEPSNFDLLIIGAPAGGNFKLTFDGQTTGTIAYNASAADVVTALVTLSNLDPGDVSATGGPLPATITLGIGPTGDLTTTDEALTGGTGPDARINVVPDKQCAGCSDPCNPNCPDYDDVLASDCDGPCGDSPCNPHCGGTPDADECDKGCDQPCNPNCPRVYEPGSSECEDGCQDECDPECPNYDPEKASCPDNEPPEGESGQISVTWVDPTEGESISGVVTLSVTAAVTAADAEDATIDEVRFFLDGGPDIENSELGASQSADPFTFVWDTTSVVLGAHTLKAVAYWNGKWHAATINVIVADIEDPTVTWLSPSAGTVPSAVIPLTVDAVDNDEVVSVQFVLDPEGTPQNIGGPVLGAPWRVLFDTRDFATCGPPEEPVAVTAQDDFADALLLGECGRVSFDTTGLTTEVGEEPPFGQDVAWFKWVAPADGTMSVDTIGTPDVDTVLGVFQGTEVDDLTEIATDDDSGDPFDPGNGLSSYLTFDAIEGETYYFAVGGFDEGEVWLTWQSLSGLLTVRALATDSTGNEGSADRSFLVGETIMPVLDDETQSAWPVAVRVYLDVTSQPKSADENWIEITERVRAFSFGYGFASDSDDADTGEGLLTLENVDRTFESYYPGSSFYPDLLPMSKVKVEVETEADTYLAFVAFVESWTQSYPSSRRGEVTVKLVDSLYFLRRASFAANMPRERTGARIGRVLDLLGWSAVKRDIDEGKLDVRLENLLSSEPGDTDDNEEGLSYTQEIAACELGRLFGNKRGWLAYHDRDHRSVAERSVEPQAYLGDGGLARGELPYEGSPQIDVSAERVRNVVRARRDVEGSAVQTVSDQDSIDRYGPCSEPESGFVQLKLASDLAVRQFARTVLQALRQPFERVDEVVLDLRRSSAFFDAVLPLEISDLIVFLRRPQDDETATPIRLASYIEHVYHQVEMREEGRSWTTTLALTQPPPPGGELLSSP